jgi:hypothetical protein
VRTTLLLITILAADPAIAGPCKFHHDLGFLPLLLTAEGARIDQHGGVVVAAISTRLERATFVDPTQQDWLFGNGAQHVKVVRTVIAPGLTVHAPALTSPELVFEDQSQHAMIKVHYQPTTDATVLAAPKVDAVTFSDRNLGVMLRAITIAKLGAAPPPGAVALVVFGGDKPRSWARIEDRSRLDITVYADDDCELRIPGTIATRTGDRVSLAWLDATGHLSARSPVITAITPK